METEFVRWTEDGTEHSAVWRSTSGATPPKTIRVADDSMTADEAYRLACEGTALLWRGDFHNARQLGTAVAARTDRKARKTSTDPATAFHLHRQTQSRRAGILGMLLVPFDADQTVPLRRAPDVRQAVLEAYGPTDQPTVTTLRDLLGAIGAHEWQKKGVEIPALGARIHPGYGVFSPIRGEYVDLVADTPLPSLTTAFDIGTGTGVLAAVLAHRGVEKVIATELDANALACARANLDRLGYAGQVQVVETDLFPDGRAPLVVCNPPWIPARPTSPIEYAIYDPDSRMLRGFLAGLAEHLEPGGEGWLILSDIAEHLGLRTRDELLTLIDEAGLTVLGRRDVVPRHGKVADRSDALHAARKREVTSLWRLGAQDAPAG
ncbi:adenine specific DNA-methyltransferase [Rhodococcus opacus PD630]|uniref:methyltransferase n=1 Tax=Rhodococcus opacus TaxID=37919 RepID=UPI00029CCD5F|nr:class I SAM-dependent methyltransferase [Rhodococcus opacus]AHK32947.1 Protein methyltransferase hemK [Rhodococcus opacus PD630]EHI41097.1 adenine specific DNA-methyltransferase [Rhodococcus opacus PD630]UDG95275.1 class I SAM-dependent methyltransferase [Rhodococcus opacus PD630]